MKKIILFVSLFVSVLGYSQIAQDTTDSRILCYDTAININLSPKFGLERKAEFMDFNYNLENKNLVLRWRISYYKDGQPVQLFGKNYEDKYQIADQTTFVNMQGTVLNDTTGVQEPFMRQFDFYKLSANRGTGGMSIHQMIIAAGMLPGKWKD